MQYLVIFKGRPDATDEVMRPMLKPEAAKAWEMLKEGVLRTIWYLPPDPPKQHGHAGSVVLLECASEEDARSQIKRFPMVQNDLVSFELLTLTPCDSYEALFAKAG